MADPFPYGPFGPGVSVEWGRDGRNAIVCIDGALALIDVTDGGFCATSDAAGYQCRNWLTLHAAVDWLVACERNWRARMALIHAVNTVPPNLWVGP